MTLPSVSGWRHFAHRLWAMVVKEVIQLRRDRLTFAMMVVIPLMQLVLFGYAINTDPKRLPTALLSMDQSVYARSVVTAIENTGYFKITHRPPSVAALDYLIEAGRVQFAVEIPPDFARDIHRGRRPSLLVIADATDPSATGNAIAALNRITATALAHDLPAPAENLDAASEPFDIIVHRRYNPAGDTQDNIVPALLGVVLTLTMLIFTALAVTREIERGTMENLLALPVRPVEVMLGKIIPYIFIGFVQTALILGAAFLLFGVPMRGSLVLLLGLTTLFIAAMLSVGYTFSTIARNQLQAVQMSFFFFLPNLLLSGFMFPFRGMPVWAQWLGEILPLTHFLRIVRGIMLKGSGMDAIHRDVVALLIFTAAVMLVALKRYRQTLD